ncbi:MAG TPA: YgjP-like metallopeptidase domain-containing protein, partial [Sphingomonas sp.]|nr:YgjP-like metallopeptidase domain-containing protein [Sphingomonas sp.]
MTGQVEVVRNARARRIRLSVDPRDGRVRLTLPPRASLRKALAWAEAQQGWIETQRARIPETQPFGPGQRIPFAGAEIEIAWDAKGPRTPRREGDRLICGGPPEMLARRVERWLRAEALRL